MGAYKLPLTVMLEKIIMIISIHFKSACISHLEAIIRHLRIDIKSRNVGVGTGGLTETSISLALKAASRRAIA